MKYAPVPVSAESYKSPVIERSSVNPNTNGEKQDSTGDKQDTTDRLVELLEVNPDSTTSGGKVEDQTQRSVGSDGVKENDICNDDSVTSDSIKSMPDPFICQGCGNEKEQYHQFLFGTILLQDILSEYNKKSGDLEEKEIDEKFDTMYNVRLQTYIQLEHGMYDEKDDYDPPVCLLEGALKEAKTLVKTKNTLSYLQRKRGYAVAHRFVTFTKDGSEFNDM